MTSKKPKRAKLGDVYAIRMGERAFAVAKVIYVSRYFRNVIAVAIADVVLEEPIPSATPMMFEGEVIYTAQGCAQHEWTFLTTSPVSEAEEARTTRLVAGNVYRNDEVLRPASESDRRTLRSMGVAGCGAVLLRLEKLFGENRA